TGRYGTVEETAIGPAPLREPKTDSTPSPPNVPARSDMSVSAVRVSQPALSATLAPTMAPRRGLLPQAPTVSFSPAPSIALPPMPSAPTPPPEPSAVSLVPRELQQGEVLGVLAAAIASRTTGALCFE